MAFQAFASGCILDNSFEWARSACHKSTACCAFSQNSGLFPKKRDSRKAIDGLTALRSRNTSLIVCRETPRAFARDDTLML